MAIVRGAGWIVPEADFDVADHLQLRGLRPLSRAGRLACVAASRALVEPLPAAPERCAVVVGTRFASIEPLVEFNRAALADGPGLVNPSAFPNVVVSAHAGYLGILFGLAGPNVTLCGADAGLAALGHGLDLLELGRADAVLAGGVDASGETLDEGMRRAGVEQLEEAAAFLLLARDGEGPELNRSDVARLAPESGDGAAAGALAAVLAAEARSTVPSP